MSRGVELLKYRILASIDACSPHLPADDRAQIAARIVHDLQLDYGGERIYIPALSRDWRNQAVRSQFNGQNREEICQHYRISTSTLYAIVSRIK